MHRQPPDARTSQPELLDQVAVAEDRLRLAQERAAQLEQREAALLATLQRITVEIRGGHQVALMQQNRSLSAALALLARVIDGHVKDATQGTNQALRQMMELAAEEARHRPELGIAEVVDRLLAPRKIEDAPAAG